ncbi:hypothetical protein [Nonomuraea insulae]|uniref:D-alanyl-D-alanine carboxypeptidase-like protein n=1 Tax=Nonomuraea insulae TaxID=1616787 RepID=A0ABW1CE32_9ACTN
MRLIVVALLGIEITIIALASAASAATHPEGSAVPGSLYEVDGWMGGPELGLRTVAYGDLMEVYERLETVHDWPSIDPRWPNMIHENAWDTDEFQGDWTAQDDFRVDRITRDDFRADRTTRDESRADRTTQETRTPSAASKAVKSPVRRKVTKRYRIRPHVAHRHAQVDLTRVLPRQAAVQISHATANGWLKSAGLRTKSTGGCASKHQLHCTSLDSVRTGTIAKVIQLKQQSGCPIMVTGGTERGHAPGQFSHGNGYKLDISHNACIDRHITKNHHKAGTRADGAKLYKSGAGTTFADESDHWDILFR